MMSHPLRTWSTVHLGVLAICVAFAHLTACTRSEAPPAPQAAPQPAGFRLTRVDVGNAIGADKKVTAPSTSFKPTDTIYASISTEGAAASVVLTARWTFEDGQVVNESTQTIAPTGPAVTEFHIAKPDGWPAGTYKLEVLANGEPAGAAQFTVTD